MLKFYLFYSIIREKPMKHHYIIFYILFLCFGTVYGSSSQNIEKFLKKININQYGNAIKILNINDNLLVFNGLNQLGIYNSKKEKIINLDSIKESYTLNKILLNDDYIVLVFNSFYSVIAVINRKTFAINYWHMDETVAQCNLLKNKIILTNLVNTMSCYNMKKELLWKNNYNYSHLFFDVDQNLLIDKKIYWIFNKNTIHILNTVNGQIDETIKLKNNQIIVDTLLYKNKIIIITDKGIYIYNKLSLELNHYVENIFPVSKGVIHGDILLFHDNKFLYQYNLQNNNLDKLTLKSDKDVTQLQNIFILEDNIIIPTSKGLWYLINKNEVKKKSLWKLWSNITPTVYNKKIIFYQNFSVKYLRSLTFNDLIKL